MTRSVKGTMCQGGRITVVSDSVGRKTRGPAERPAFKYSERSDSRSDIGRHPTAPSGLNFVGMTYVTDIGGTTYAKITGPCRNGLFPVVKITVKEFGWTVLNSFFEEIDGKPYTEYYEPCSEKKWNDAVGKIYLTFEGGEPETGMCPACLKAGRPYCFLDPGWRESVPEFTVSISFQWRIA